jgi:hypothetical protein
MRTSRQVMWKACRVHIENLDFMILLPLIVIQYVVVTADLKRPVGEDCHISRCYSCQEL